MIYLENSGIEYKGIKIYGTPILASRVERFGKRYYSDAFERIKDIRVKCYD